MRNVVYYCFDLELFVRPRWGFWGDSPQKNVNSNKEKLSWRGISKSMSMFVPFAKNTTKNPNFKRIIASVSVPTLN